MLRIKHKMMAHQDEALKFISSKSTLPDCYGLLMEQGTGKTPVEIVDAARRWEAGQINALLVLAPNGVQSNWVLRELPKHMPEGVKWAAAAWYSGAGRHEQEMLDQMINAPAESLHVLCMNWEALTTQKGLAYAQKFCEKFAGRLKVTVDESQRIKNPKAERTKKLLLLKKYTTVRSILSGTMILNSPFDAFSQFGWLNENILRTSSFPAFKAEYAEIMPPTSGLMQHLAKQGIKYLPQIVIKDAQGRPKWRNLDKLEALIAPHIYRVLKKDCLDLPEKVYQQRWFQMTPKQESVYAKLRDELRILLEDGSESPIAKIGSITKLSQLVSGFYLVPGTDVAEWLMVQENNPKFNVLMEELETSRAIGEQVIIWARFQAELKAIAVLLKAKGWSYVEYHGEVTKKKERIAAIDKFERGEVEFFLSQQAAGGTGLTLIAPKSMTKTMSVIYFSNTWSLDDRLQSEDRAHRIGQEKSVRYVDILGEDTLDAPILTALRNKQDIAAIITGDARRAAATLLNFDRGFDQ